MKRSRIAALAAVVLLVAATAPAALARPGDGSKAEESAQTTDGPAARAQRLPRQPRAADAARAGRIGTRAAGRASRRLRPRRRRGVPRHARRARSRRPTRTRVVVSAGDLIGATPAALGAVPRRAHDRVAEPDGARLHGVGNHEFDEGVDELLRMQNGGCHPVDGCQDGDAFAGADFQLPGGERRHKDTRQDHLPAPTRSGTSAVSRSAFIGMTLEGTPSIVTPSGRRGPGLQRRGGDRQRAGARLAGQGRRDASSCCSTRAAPAGTASARSTINELRRASSGPLLDDRRAARRRDRRRRHRPHQLGRTTASSTASRHGRGAVQGRLVTDIDLTIRRATRSLGQRQRSTT